MLVPFPDISAIFSHQHSLYSKPTEFISVKRYNNNHAVDFTLQMRNKGIKTQA